MFFFHVPISLYDHPFTIDPGLTTRKREKKRNIHIIMSLQNMSQGNLWRLIAACRVKLKGLFIASECGKELERIEKRLYAHIPPISVSRIP